MWGHRKRTEQALAELREKTEASLENCGRFMKWTENTLMRLDKELNEARAASAELFKRLEALERANWHKGIENNCTECREAWNK